jgi:hypothetical protein
MVKSYDEKLRRKITIQIYVENLCDKVRHVSFEIFFGKIQWGLWGVSKIGSLRVPAKYHCLLAWYAKLATRSQTCSGTLSRRRDGRRPHDVPVAWKVEYGVYHGLGWIMIRLSFMPGRTYLLYIY